MREQLALLLERGGAGGVPRRVRRPKTRKICDKKNFFGENFVIFE